MYINSPKPSKYIAFYFAQQPKALQNHRVQRKVMKQVLEKII